MFYIYVYSSRIFTYSCKKLNQWNDIINEEELDRRKFHYFYPMFKKWDIFLEFKIVYFSSERHNIDPLKKKNFNELINFIFYD